MATQPITFNLPSSSSDYHLVSREDLNKKDHEVFQKRIDELNMRVQHAKRYFKGKYDDRHKRWMQTLAKPLKQTHKLSLSLDALIALSDIEKK